MITGNNAILVGFDYYARPTAGDSSTAFAPLKGAVSDTETVSLALVSRCGEYSPNHHKVTIAVAEDLGDPLGYRDKFLSSIKSFLDCQDWPDDSPQWLVFHYSGHGVSTAHDTAPALVLPSFDDDLFYTHLISIGEIHALVVKYPEISGAIYFLDSCRVPELNVMAAPKPKFSIPIAAFTACAHLEDAKELRFQKITGEDSIGVFSTAVAEALHGAADTDADGTITLDELRNFLNVRVNDFRVWSKDSFRKWRKRNTVTQARIGNFSLANTGSIMGNTPFMKSIPKGDVVFNVIPEDRATALGFKLKNGMQFLHQIDDALTFRIPMNQIGSWIEWQFYDSDGNPVGTLQEKFVHYLKPVNLGNENH